MQKSPFVGKLLYFEFYRIEYLQVQVYKTMYKAKGRSENTWQS